MRTGHLGRSQVPIADIHDVADTCIRLSAKRLVSCSDLEQNTAAFTGAMCIRRRVLGISEPTELTASPLGDE